MTAGSAARVAQWAALVTGAAVLAVTVAQFPVHLSVWIRGEAR